MTAARHPDRMYDIVVIGAGIAGLTAAALAARHGLAVALVEQHSRPGGCASDFVRGGVRFPAGATMVTGFEQGGLHRWVYERLGIPIRARAMDLAMICHLPDRTVRVFTDRERWDEERRRAFPELGSSGDRFWSTVSHHARTAHWIASKLPTLPVQSARDALPLARLTRPGTITAAPLLFATVNDLLSRAGAYHSAHRAFVDNQLLITMQTTADSCVALNGALALDLYRFGCFSLDGGPPTIARDLAASFVRSGGVLRYRERVLRLSFTRGSWRVTTATGTSFGARSVIANVPAANLAQLLGPVAPPAVTRRVPVEENQWGAAVLYIAARPDRHMDGLPSFHQVVECPPGRPQVSYFISAYPPQPTPETPLITVTVSTHTPAEPWLHSESEEAYRASKAAISARLLHAAERALPGISAHVAMTDAATPRTFRTWTLRHGGRVGGIPRTLQHSNLQDFSHRAGLPGLFACGDTVFPGQGTIGVTLSGINAWRAASAALRPSA
ncbi:MAG: FAD-dependent oxidoreductase [Chloroflexota bacterium]